MKGKFIVFEGIDGSGKTTQAKMLCEHFNDLGKSSIFTSEPTGSVCGKLLRSVLGGAQALTEEAVAALFTTDRLEHINGSGGLLENLNAGTNVICDRYYFSSYAYNAHSLPVEDIIKLNAMCAQKLRPDLCIFIDLSPETAMTRINANRAPSDIEIYESEQYLKTVYSRYKKSFELTCDDENVIIINGNRNIEQVFEDVLTAVKMLG